MPLAMLEVAALHRAIGVMKSAESMGHPVLNSAVVLASIRIIQRADLPKILPEAKHYVFDATIGVIQ